MPHLDERSERCQKKNGKTPRAGPSQRRRYNPLRTQETPHSRRKREPRKKPPLPSLASKRTPSPPSPKSPRSSRAWKPDWESPFASERKQNAHEPNGRPTPAPTRSSSPAPLRQTSTGPTSSSSPPCEGRKTPVRPSTQPRSARWPSHWNSARSRSE